MRRAVWIFTATSLFALSLTSCKQAEGESCQLDSDCDDELICCVQPNVVKAGGHGTCLTQNACDVTSDPDGGADAAPKEAGADGPLADMVVDTKVTPDTAADAKVTSDTTVTPDTAVDAKVTQDTTVTPDTVVTPDTTVTPDTATAADAATAD